jgi:hypothetical protein
VEWRRWVLECWWRKAERSPADTYEVVLLFAPRQFQNVFPNQAAAPTPQAAPVNMPSSGFNPGPIFKGFPPLNRPLAGSTFPGLTAAIPGVLPQGLQLPMNPYPGLAFSGFSPLSALQYGGLGLTLGGGIASIPAVASRFGLSQSLGPAAAAIGAGLLGLFGSPPPVFQPTPTPTPTPSPFQI